MLLFRQCDKTDLTDIIESSLASIADGIVHPLKVRIESVLNTVNDTVILYSIANLIRFYYNIIHNMIKSGQFQEFMNETQKVSEQFYLNSLNARVRDILSQNYDFQQSDMLMPPLAGEKKVNFGFKFLKRHLTKKNFKTKIFRTKFNGNLKTKFFLIHFSQTPSRDAQRTSKRC